MDKILINEAIARLSNALALLSEREINKEAIRNLTLGIIPDEKHKLFIEIGLAQNDKAKVMHGIVGALSHYEAEKEKANFEKRFNFNDAQA
jgi:hypothetical protein